MYYPDEVIEEVRSRSDIVDVVGTYVGLTRKGANYVGLCPFHNEKTGSFMVSKDKQMYKCFGCGKGGGVFTFLMEYDNCTFSEAVQTLAERAGVKLPEREMTEEQKRQRGLKDKLLEINRETAKFFYMQLRSPQGENAMNYLLGRQLSEETMKAFGLGFAGKYSDGLYKYLKSRGYDDELIKQSGLVTLSERGPYDKFWNRVIFPIMDVNGKVIAFGGRIMGSAENAPKYLNSPETKVYEKGYHLFGLNIAKRSRLDYMIICEGYMDCISLHQAGFTNAVASLGTALTPNQAKLMSRYVKQVILSYDSDEAGTKATLRNIQIMKEAGITPKVLLMHPYKDPDDVIKSEGAEGYQRRIENAVNAFYFELDLAYRKVDPNDPDSKTVFQHTLAAKLAAIPDEFERNNYLDATAGRYGVDAMALRREMNKEGQKQYEESIAKETVERERMLQAKRTRPDDGIRKAQAMLLTELAADVRLLERLKKVIGPSDFTDELYRKAAELIYESYEATGAVVPARILNRFEDAAEQGAVASLITENLPEVLNDAEREKALREMVLKVKKNSLDTKIKEAVAENNASVLNGLLMEQRDLAKLKF